MRDTHHISSVVDSHVVWFRGVSQEMRNKLSVSGELTHAVIVRVGNNNIIMLIDGDTFWPVQEPVGIAPLRNPTNRFTGCIGVEHLQAVVARVGNDYTIM